MSFYCVTPSPSVLHIVSIAVAVKGVYVTRMLRVCYAVMHHQHQAAMPPSCYY